MSPDTVIAVIDRRIAHLDALRAKARIGSHKWHKYDEQRGALRSLRDELMDRAAHAQAAADLERMTTPEGWTFEPPAFRSAP